MTPKRHVRTATALAAVAALGLSVLAAPAAGSSQTRGTSDSDHAALEVVDLEVDGSADPPVVGDRTPQLGWRLVGDGRSRAQSAYEIEVASSGQALLAGDADVWASGRIEGDANRVELEDVEPASRDEYHWRVRVWDELEQVSAWSDPHRWEVGLLDADDWSAAWIARDLEASIPDTSGPGDVPIEIEDTTLGQSFTTDRPFQVVEARVPTWGDEGVEATVRLHADDPDGELLVETRVTGIDDGAWVGVELDDPLDAGIYYLEISEVAGGQLGWWSFDDDLYAHGTAWEDGEPIDDIDRSFRWSGEDPEADYDGRTSQLRRDFELDGEVAHATVRHTSLGVHELSINGELVNDQRFAPGWTDYEQRLQYLTDDVTHLLEDGGNAITAELSTGWYAGAIAIFGPNLYGDQPAMFAQLEITYTDGRTETVVTDDDWTTVRGPIVGSDMQHGESYDARERTPGWTEAGYDDDDWEAVVVPDDLPDPALVPQADPPVRELEERPAEEITQPESGVHVVDLGQNMVGTVRLHLEGADEGDEIRLRFGEVLDEDGNVYRDNLRSARVTDYYTAAGDDVEVWDPRFTFHGFRYVEVTGYPGDELPEDAITGIVIGSELPETGEFATSDEMLNQLQENIVWSQRGNFLSIPTDTPARDERMGWTGDINVFAPTATFNTDSRRFISDKWMTDVRDAQREDGAITDVAPYVPVVGGGNAGWGDAAVTVPYTLWRSYGEARVIEENYEAMQDWIAYLEDNSDDLRRPDAGYGDHLHLDDETPRDLIGTAYFAHVTRLLAEMAEVIGEDEDAADYHTLADDVTEVFQDTYVLVNGRLQTESQTGYVLALSFGLVPDDLVDAAAGRLATLVEGRGGHLSTGFLGTPDLLPVLGDHGRLDLAYQLLTNRSFPSWGYQIDRGATTTWEHWDSILPDGSFQDPEMNSFNHYAYGAVGSWMYEHVGGLRAAEPGYRHSIIRPEPGGSITSATVRHDSPHGPVGVSWQLIDGDMALDVEVPVSTTASVHVPVDDGQVVLENGQPVADRDGVTEVSSLDGYVTVEVGSGTYAFTAADDDEDPPVPPGQDPCEDVPPTSFPDARGTFHEAAIACLEANGLALGTTDGRFRPTANLTRDQLASFVDRLLSRVGHELEAPDRVRFPDVVGSPHAVAVERLAQAGIVQGKEPGRFAPRDTVTRAQTAAMLVRAVELVAGERLPAPGSGFVDIGPPHARDIDAAHEAGIVLGRTATEFQPQREVRREQVAAMIARTLTVLITSEES